MAQPINSATVEDHPPRDAIVSGKAMSLVTPFLQKEVDYQLYTSLIHLEPERNGEGVILVVSNGFYLVMSHDPLGYTNGTWNCTGGEWLKKPAKKPDSLVHFIGDAVHVTPEDYDPREEGTPLWIESASFPPSENPYPDFWRVIPKNIPSNWEAVSGYDYDWPLVYNGKLMKSFLEIANRREYTAGNNPLLICPTSNRGSIICIYNQPDFFGYLMPLKIEGWREIPTFALGNHPFASEEEREDG